MTAATQSVDLVFEGGGVKGVGLAGSLSMAIKRSRASLSFDMSGYADETLLARAAEARSFFLEKPFSSAELTRTLREALS